MARKIDKVFFASLAACGLRFINSATAQVAPPPAQPAPDLGAGLGARTAPGADYGTSQGDPLSPLGIPATGSATGAGSAGLDPSPYPGAGGPATAAGPGSPAYGGPGQAGGFAPPGGFPGPG